MTLPVCRFFVALLAALVFAQGAAGATHGHAFEEAGSEPNHACQICKTRAAEEFVVGPTGPVHLAADLRSAPLKQAPAPANQAASRTYRGPRAPPVSISL